MLTARVIVLAIAVGATGFASCPATAADARFSVPSEFSAAVLEALDAARDRSSSQSTKFSANRLDAFDARSSLIVRKG